MDSARYLLSSLKTLQELKKIKKGLRHACGVAISVRSGVAADDPHQEHDHELRPWVTVETSNDKDMEVYITTLIATQTANALFWKRTAEEHIVTAQEALATFAATPL